jgi:hypothetical protein
VSLDAFHTWLYDERAALVRRMAAGADVTIPELHLGFCRHTPVVCSNGPAGLNAAVKGVGFIPREEFLAETLKAYVQHLERDPGDDYQQRALQLLVTYLYSKEARERLDFALLGSLELARGRTWENLRATHQAVLLFYQPPATSFEVHATVEVHEQGSPYHTLLNAQHDVYHGPQRERWPGRPAYVFELGSVRNKAPLPGGWGAPQT